jgi:hypothetical protein
MRLACEGCFIRARNVRNGGIGLPGRYDTYADGNDHDKTRCYSSHVRSFKVAGGAMVALGACRVKNDLQTRDGFTLAI